ncbi:pesticidal crystal protein Cry22Aa [Kordia sp. SMS9]|uniref:immunoglobulin-like domain-containing protein n=1 Tax=Kordia sp. SMS9 TaxID=2282170 RepID=UPI000E0CFE7E|nr:immunoglobulin-like domain-containing protein [Kordia sp. SMS9]AXG71264.1 pesticidal crystal protein Cry22Aa [Kordia sp. SMS9]
MKKALHLMVFCLLTSYVQAQTPGVSTYYEQTVGDTRNYIEYIPGNLPIIISAPHGGIQQSGQTIGGIFYPDNDSSLPDRTCGTNERDDNTDILVREIQKEIFELTGCYAHVIINNLHRSKLDPNRDINEATCGNANAADHWNAFHGFIDQASASVETNWGKGLYIDLHGQSHAIPRIEVGYNIASAELNNSDLNAANIINKSTIRNLVNNNLNNLTHEELIRGNNSLGQMFQDASGTFYASLGYPECGNTSGYRAIPSATSNGTVTCDDTRPYGTPYFDGDFYNNRRHGSGNGTSNGVGGAGNIDGIMTEVNRRVRDLGTYNGQVYDTRPQTLVPFAKDYAAVVLNFINTHYNNYTSFGYASDMYTINGPNPSPIIGGVSNGIFSAPAGLAINANTGEIDVANSALGDYVITYTAGTCGYFSSSQTIAIVTDIAQDTEPPTAPSNLTAVNTTETTTDLLWAPSMDNVDLTGYNIYQDDVIVATEVSNSFVVTNLAPNTIYTFKITAFDAAGNESASSNEVTIITLQSAVLNYCDSQSTSQNDEYISNVQFGAINNASGAQFYSDFTNISTELIKNGQYILTVTPTWPTTVYNESYAAWIDYNQDGDFTDAGEQVWTQSNTQQTPVSTMITIPTSVPNGTTRMRISMRYNAMPTPCETFNYGEVEDYTVTIVSGEQDSVPPIITLLGENPIQLVVNESYTDAGATAIDNVDGDLTDLIEVTGTVNTAVVGSYTLFYDVRDTAGNEATQVTRTVNVIEPVDDLPPVITLNGDATVNLNVGDLYTELGATAVDNVDGDLSNIINITGSVDTSVAGTYIILYNVSDAAGNAAAEVTRTVNVFADTTIPVITLNGDATINLNVGDTYNELGATATDNIDGNLTGNILINGTVDTSVAGTYFITYNVSDAAGNAATEVTRTVNIIADTTIPVITLLGEAVITLNVGDVYTEFGAAALDNIDGDISSNISISGTVDTSVVGTYIIRYNVTDLAGNAAVEVIRTVLVEAIGNGCANGISTFPYTKSFENTLGNWVQSSQDDIDWTLNSGGTPSNGTGPSSAIDGNTYIYVEASGNGTGYPDKQAIITSPCFDLTQLTAATFSFSYHMFGTDMGTLDVDISEDNGTTWTSIWTKTGNQGDAWQTTNIDLTAYTGSTVQLRFNRITGSTWRADIAIDNIRLLDEVITVEGCANGIGTFPYAESYENSIGAWTQSFQDDLNWTVRSGGTPSNGTGPSGAINGNTYIYVEASGNGTGFPNKQAIINSPCFDLTNETSAIFSFSYHMFGSSDSGTISLDISEDNAQSWTTIWLESGNKGNQWNNVNLDISEYVGGSVQFRFNRVTGGTWQADVAIDNIALNTTMLPRQETVNTKETKETKEDTLVDTSIANTLTIFPNPVRGNLINIQLDRGTAKTYTIMNVYGQTIASGTASKQLQLHKIPSGVYFLEVSDGHHTLTKKFIKQ